MAKKKTLNDIMAGASPAVRRKNPAPLPGTEAPAKNRRPAAENKSEAEWHQALINRNPGAHIVSQAKGYFVLPGTSDTYTPDLMVIHGFLPIEVWEIKGGYRGPGWEQGYERYKRAAQFFSDGIKYQFYLAEKVGGKWQWRKWNNSQSPNLPKEGNG